MKVTDLFEQHSRSVLHVFDIDDTLFHTNALIHVMKGSETVRTLNNQEFNDYKLKDGETFDFKEFKSAEKFNRESIPMTRMLDNLKRIHDKIKVNLSPGSKIIMNTARGDFDDAQKVLDTFKQQGVDIDDIHIHRAGALPGDAIPAEKKLVFIRKYMNKHDYAEVFMYDDSKTNLKHFLQLKKEYPNTKFYAFIVSREGNIRKFT